MTPETLWRIVLGFLPSVLVLVLVARVLWPKGALLTIASIVALFSGLLWTVWPVLTFPARLDSPEANPQLARALLQGRVIGCVFIAALGVALMCLLRRWFHAVDPGDSDNIEMTRVGGRRHMTTPIDTDEGRARPSVWPVYIMAVAIGAYSTWGLVTAAIFLGPFLLGVVAVIGIVRLRPWGWWSAVVWTVIWIGSAAQSSIYEYGFRQDGIPYGAWVFFVLPFIIWPLATRRQLFFPPKPEGED